MVQPKTSKFLFLSSIFVIVTLLVMVGCSNGDAEGNSKTKEQESDYEEADETALEYTKARYEYDIPVIFDLSVGEVQDDYLNGVDWFRYFTKTDGADLTSNPPMDDLIDPDQYKDIKIEYDSEDYQKNHDDFFRNFNENGTEDLFVVRFDDLFGDDQLGYFVKPWLKTYDNAGEMERINEAGAGYLRLEKGEGDWKVNEVRKVDFTDKGIDVTDVDDLKQQGKVVFESEEEN